MLVRQPPSAERLAERQAAKRTLLRVTCEGCGAVVHTASRHAARGCPHTFAMLAKQGLDRHMRVSGCAGVKAP
jgi:hypothetical protein